jgi:hypothetical protein
MKDLMLLMADAMPLDMIIEMVEEKLQAVKENPTLDNKKYLMLPLMMITTKLGIEINGTTIEETIERMDNLKALNDLMAPNKS